MFLRAQENQDDRMTPIRFGSPIECWGIGEGAGRAADVRVVLIGAGGRFSAA
jgi:hypothetical protein